MTAKKPTTEKAPKAPKAVNTPKAAAPVVAGVQSAPDDISGKVSGHFSEIRTALLKPYETLAKTPRMLRLALTAIDMAENATVRHLRHNG